MNAVNVGRCDGVVMLLSGEGFETMRWGEDEGEREGEGKGEGEVGEGEGECEDENDEVRGVGERIIFSSSVHG